MTKAPFKWYIIKSITSLLMRIVHFSYFQVAYMLYWWVDFGNENLASLEREREREMHSIWVLWKRWPSRMQEQCFPVRFGNFAQRLLEGCMLWAMSLNTSPLPPKGRRGRFNAYQWLWCHVKSSTSKLKYNDARVYALHCLWYLMLHV